MTYGTHPFSLVNELAQSRINYWHFDVDTLHHPWWFIHKIARKTGTSLLKAYNTQLYRFKGTLFCKNSPGLSFWCCPISRYGDQNTKFGHQICTRCITEDPLPYFRQQWRLATQTVCHIHNVFLLDACPRCQNPIQLFSTSAKRNNTTVFGFEHCTTCGFSWKDHIPVASQSRQRALFEKVILDSLNRGSTPSPDGQWKHSLSLVTGIAQLLRVLCSKSDQYHVRADTFHLMGLDHSFKANWLPRYSFNGFRIEYRAKILDALSWLLLDWPNNLLKVAEIRSLTSNALLDSKLPLPFWYENPIRQTIFHGWYRYSEIEIQSARAYLLRHYGMENDYLVNKILGRLK